MKKFTLCTIALALAAIPGCGGESTSPEKIAVTEMERDMIIDPDGDGVAEGTVSETQASISFELEDPLPTLDEAAVHPGQKFRAFEGATDAALRNVFAALEIVVSNPLSGVSVSLMNEGMLVESPPSAPGEWSALLSDDRRVLVFSWYNGTTSGLQLRTGLTYDILFSLGNNCCISSIPATSKQFVLSGSGSNAGE